MAGVLKGTGVIVFSHLMSQLTFLVGIRTLPVFFTITSQASSPVLNTM